MEVFVFPLVNVTLFPRTIKPLHIFEARYLTMIQEAIATGSQVAVGYIEEPSAVGPIEPGVEIPFIRKIAGYGRPEIIEERINGTLLVFLHGEGKVRLGKVLDRGRPYPICEAEIVFEQTQLEPENDAHLTALQKILNRWIFTHIVDEMQREIFLKNVQTPEEILASFAAYLVRDHDMQQMALEIDDINEKLKFLLRLAESNELSPY